MKRRTFLKGAGVVTVVAASGGMWRAVDQGVFAAGEGPAFEPWTDWRGEVSEGPLALVRAAILGANPHNTQPWLFEVSDAWLEVYADTTRNLGAFDPYLREMHLGLGCALENLLLAAAAEGYETVVTLSEGELTATPARTEPQRVARVELSPADREPGDLYDRIPVRRTNRGPYDPGRPVSRDALAMLRRMAEHETEIDVRLYSSPQERARFSELVVGATEAIIADDVMVRDSDRWFRHSWADVQRFRDGPTLDTAGLSPPMTAVAKMLPAPSAEANHQYWLDATRDVHVATAPLFGLVTVRALYDRVQTLHAGRLWQRMHLWATTQGLAMQPLNQPVEMVDRERELKHPPRWARELEAIVGDPAWKPTFAFRAGYPLREVPPSPRRPVDEVVVS